MYYNSRDLDTAKLLFESMPEKTLVSWNAMMTGFRQHSLHKEIMVSFGEMTRDGKRPNHITLLNLLPACFSRLQDGIGTRQSNHIEPNLHLCSSKQPKARQFYNRLHNMQGIQQRSDYHQHIQQKSDYHQRPYRFVCKKWKHFNGKKAIQSVKGKRQCFLKCDDQRKKSVQNYLNGILKTLHLLLHNIYAANGRWNDTEKMRCEMVKED
ncbi:hypothetical protein G4B88_012802 [Cannabis sativa]|uniref:Pentatricopeptide repeat-containing protein n=1 Tax=Cannabis sativa TaxID=3483 RepID=A0A7J6DM33_CANSA|nr:hypothetical protein G4B88_012802 [Cannabis sativa]